MADNKETVEQLRQIAMDPEKATRFIAGESEDAAALREEMDQLLDDVGAASRKAFEEKTGEDVDVDDRTLAWITLLRHLVNDMDCRVDDAETVWYIS